MSELTLTIKQMLEAIGPMQKLQREQLSPRTAFRIARVVRQLDQEIALYYEAKRDIFEEWAVEDEGEPRIPPEQKQAYIEELQPLLQEEVSIDAKAISIEELNGITLTPQEAMALGWLVNGEEKNE